MERIPALQTAGIRTFSSGPESFTPADRCLPGEVRRVEVGKAPARVRRASFPGELGFESHVTTDVARHLFARLAERCDPSGLRPAGIHAMGSCRIEKGSRDFGHDVADEGHGREVGLGLAAQADRAPGPPGHFHRA